MRSEFQEVLWLASRVSGCTKLLLPATTRLRLAHQRGNQSSTASNRGRDGGGSHNIVAANTVNRNSGGVRKYRNQNQVFPKFTLPES